MDGGRNLVPACQNFITIFLCCQIYQTFVNVFEYVFPLLFFEIKGEFLLPEWAGPILLSV